MTFQCMLCCVPCRGRRDTDRNLDWIEMWGLDDVLTLFGFPEDVNKPIPTTYVRGLEE